MKRILISFLATVVISAMACTSLWAQATAQISGTVRDQSGAVLPGVEVTATQTDRGIARTTVTNETGSYVLPNLPLGPYKLEAALQGFRSFVQTGIVLQVNSSPVINPALEVGQVTEQVEVQANAALVETRNTAVGAVMESQRILELPLEGRQVTDLILLSGAAIPTGKSAPEGWNKGTTAGTFITIAGGMNFGVMYQLDGAMHNQAYDGTSMPMPFPDALQEFKVDASGFSAAGGTRGSGGQVNAVTKSGTNDFHGDAFEFVRNYLFNAREPFALQRDTLKRNQFGGTLGGPIMKNKVFFFAGYQGTKTSTSAGPYLDTVPTPAMLAGDWTTFTSPGCNAGRQINLPAPFANNRINPAQYSKPALAIAAKLPAAQNDCGRISFTLPDKPSEYQIVGKGDYQVNAKHSIFGRYLVTAYKAPSPYETTKGFLLALEPQDVTANNNLAQSYAVGSTYLVSPNTINAFRLTVNRAAIGRPNVSFFSPADIGINAFTYTPGQMQFTISSGGFGFGARTFPANNRTTAYQVSDDVNLIRGNHQVTVGGNFANWRTYQRCHQSDEGVYTFNGQATGSGMADFLTGQLSNLNQLSPVQWSSHQWYTALYVQDVWKITPRLTMNGGLRWEPYLPLAIGFGQGPNMREGAMYNFSEARMLAGVHSTIYPAAPAGLLYPGDSGFPTPGPNFKKWNVFAPRLGFAWDPKGDGRTSLRMSYGLAYDFSGSLSFGGSSSAPPWGFGTTVNQVDFANPWATYPGGNPFPYVRLSKWPTLSQYYWVQNLHAMEPTVQNWNVSVQRQLPSNFLLTTSYIGNAAAHLWVGGNINRAVYFPGSPVNGVCTAEGFVLRTTAATCSSTANTDARRRFVLEDPANGQYYGNMATREDSGTSNYNGLLIDVQRRATRGVTVAGNYTWSHCIGDAATANATGRGTAGYLDPNNRAFDRGNCAPNGSGASAGQDRRHAGHFTAVALSPQFSNAMFRRLASGWQVSTIYTVATGDFLTVRTGVDRVLSGQAANQRPNQVLTNPYLDRDGLHLLNPAAFVQPAIGTLGNMRAANIAGPGFWKLDFGLSRIFQPREGQKLEFRAEAFNVTNSLLKGDPVASSLNLNSPTFGQITNSLVVGQSNARIMQFALKYSF